MELRRIATVALVLKVTQPAAFSSIISVCTSSLVGVAPFRFEAVPTRPVAMPAVWRSSAVAHYDGHTSLACRASASVNLTSRQGLLCGFAL
jgi:hypothetical protein